MIFVNQPISWNELGYYAFWGVYCDFMTWRVLAICIGTGECLEYAHAYNSMTGFGKPFSDGVWF